MEITSKTEPAWNRRVEKSAKPAAMKKEKTNRKPTKIWLLSGLTLAGILAVFFIEPIPQGNAYHTFADSRSFFSIPNFWNVISNLPFLIFGLAGLVSVWQKKPRGMFPPLTAAYLVFYSGIFFTGLGSAYYHLAPTNQTLLWDRLPMTIAFMVFFAIIIGEFIKVKAGQILLFPLLLIGAASVFYWFYTEMAGRGDLRFYGLVQFLPILLIPLIMLLFKAKTDTNLYTWLVILAYLLAKLFETYDDQIFAFTSLLSGHTLKHLAASLAPLLFLLGLFKRKIITEREA